MDKLFIVIPAYNEEENIRQVVEDWYPVVEKHNGGGESRLVIIDDGSKDSTFDILKSCAEDKPLLLPFFFRSSRAVRSKQQANGSTAAGSTTIA